MKRRLGWFSLILLIFVLTIGVPSCLCESEDFAAIRDGNTFTGTTIPINWM